MHATHVVCDLQYTYMNRPKKTKKPSPKYREKNLSNIMPKCLCCSSWSPKKMFVPR